MSRRKKQVWKKYVYLGIGGVVLILLAYLWILLGQFQGLAGEFIMPGKTYLVVFQNDAELRPTGGFIGAYGIYRTGVIPSIEIKDSYFLEKHSPEKAPEPVHTLLDDGEWYPGHFFRDGNISPDWPTSAEDLIRLYNLNFDEEIEFDGVVAVNFGLLEKVLGAFGEIEINGTKFSKDNLFFTLEAELRPDDTHNLEALNSRKDVLKDFAKVIMIKSIAPWSWAKASGVIREGLEEKDILIYFEDENLQKRVEEIGWSGALKQEDNDTDFLHVNIGNYGGQKTDRYIDRQVNYFVEIDRKGEASAKTEIIFKHREREGLLTGDWFGWMRVYVPEGVEVVGEQEVKTENGLNYFEEVIELKSGEEKTFVYEYDLPVRFEEKYRLELVKQSGADVLYNLHISSPAQRFLSSGEFETKENHAYFVGELEGDLDFEVEIGEDDFAPFITNQHMSDMQTIWIDVSEPLAMGRALVADNYEIVDLDQEDPKTDGVEVVAVDHYDTIVKLTISGMTNQPEERYGLTLKNQEDLSGNVMEEKQVTVVQRF